MKDVKNVARLRKILKRLGHKELARRLKALPLAEKDAIGKPVGELFELKDC